MDKMPKINLTEEQHSELRSWWDFVSTSSKRTGYSRCTSIESALFIIETFNLKRIFPDVSLEVLCIMAAIGSSARYFKKENFGKTLARKSDSGQPLVRESKFVRLFKSVGYNELFENISLVTRWGLKNDFGFFNFVVFMLAWDVKTKEPLYKFHFNYENAEFYYSE